MSRTIVRISSLAVLVFLCAPLGLDAQYFGRNKVQYESLDFHVLKTPHYDIHFYPEAADAVEDGARMAERWYERIARIFEHDIAESRPLVLYADHPDFQQTNILTGRVSEGTGGVTEGMQDRIILPLGSSYADTDHVIGHELVHSFQFDLANGGQGAGLQGLMQLPLWFIEGMAEYFSIGREDPLTSMWIRDALLHDEFPTLDEMTTDGFRYFPYRFGHAFWAYVAGRYGDLAVPMMMRTAARSGWQPAVARVLGIEPDSLGVEWQRAMEERHSTGMVGRTPPQEAGTLLLSPETGAGRQNLAPSLSPDGRFVAYLSEQDLFTIELYLADAQTGEVIRSITSSTRDAHFDALRFLDSSGAWSPDGRYVAVVVYSEGRNQIIFYEAESGDRGPTLEVPAAIGEIRNPSFSPDGSTIVFSGQAGGLTDLYLIDVETEEITRLTNDRYSQLQPTYSPDGRTVAFVTDEGPETNLDQLTYGKMALALMDLETGAVERVAPFDDVSHWNPQFTPDGEGLYFLADLDGFRDIFRLGLDNGEVWQVTEIATGVSGVTEATPALSVARETGTVAFTVFQNAEYHVYALDAIQSEGDLVVTTEERESGAQVADAPPAGSERVAPLLANADVGLVPPGTYSAEDAEPFDRSLRLSALGQPAIGVGADSGYGTYLAGSVAALFTDLLGDRNLYTAVQAQGELKDIGGQVYFQDLGRRWNWGAGASHIPFRYFRQGFVPGSAVGEGLEGTFLRVEDFRYYVSRLSGDLSYPFSAIRRTELGVGMTRYAFNSEIEDYPCYSNGLCDFSQRIRSQGDTRDPLLLSEVSLAFVEDNSFSGFTAPVRGFRTRLEVGRTIGTASFTTGLADVRRYYSPLQELTFAFRGYHFGRYGLNNEDAQVLGDVYLGDEYLIRGYSVGSFSTAECTANAIGQCGEYERLLGQKLGVVNLEARVPVLGTERFGLLYFPYLPTDLVMFFDAGMAWNDWDDASFEWDTETAGRVPVASAGVSARMNLFGALVLEIYYAHPFHRPEKGGHFGVNFNPGW